MWSVERHDKTTYLVHGPRGGGGTITKLTRRKWHAESDDTGETVTFPTMTKALWWVQEQAKKE